MLKLTYMFDSITPLFSYISFIFNGYMTCYRW